MIDTIEKLNKESFELREIFGHKVIATDLRIKRDIIPKCLHVYEMQESELAPYEIITIGKRIHVNFESTILSAEPIALEQNGYRDIDEATDVKIPVCNGVKLSEYLQMMGKHKRKEVAR